MRSRRWRGVVLRFLGQAGLRGGGAKGQECDSELKNTAAEHVSWR